MSGARAEIKTEESYEIVDSEYFIEFCDRARNERICKNILRPVIQGDFDKYRSYVPKLAEQSPYKLHISLSIEGAKMHTPALKQILLKHLEAHTIYNFKFVPVDLYLRQLKLIPAMLRVLNELQSSFFNYEGLDQEILMDERKRLAREYQVFAEKLKTTALVINEMELTQENVSGLFAALTRKYHDRAENAKRFHHGDQFTIYIPADFDANAILQLCQEINNYLNGACVVPGLHSDVVSLVGAFISLKQDLLRADFDEVNRTEKYDLAKRINSPLPRFTCPELQEAELLRRASVVNELEASSLYQFLVANLNKPTLTPVNTQASSPSKGGMFANTVNSDEVRDQPKTDKPIIENSSLESKGYTG